MPNIRTSSKNIELGVAVLKPGQIEVLHKHEATGEAFYVTSGVVTLQIGDETQQVEEGTAVYVPPDTPYRITNHGKHECKLITVKSPSHPKDKIILEE